MDIYELLFLKATGDITQQEFDEMVYANRFADCF